MEGVSATVYRGIKGYWRRRGYQRLNGSGQKRKTRAVQLASGADRKRRLFWRLKLTPRLKLKLKLRFSPKKFLLRLRDAYVNMMMRIANTRAISSGYGGDGFTGFGMRGLKDYDERMVVEIYKSVVVAQGHVAPCDAAWIGSEIACRR